MSWNLVRCEVVHIERSFEYWKTVSVVNVGRVDWVFDSFLLLLLGRLEHQELAHLVQLFLNTTTRLHLPPVRHQSAAARLCVSSDGAAGVRSESRWIRVPPLRVPLAGSSVEASPSDGTNIVQRLTAQRH